MQTGYTGYITSAEWRWVILAAVALVGLALFPFIWVLLVDVSGSGWQFMGALHHYGDGAAHLARVQQGVEGAVLVRYLHTPEAHSGLLVDSLYALLGQVARLTSLDSIAIFHAARVGAAMFMYLAIYQLAATIWMRIRTRRIFFVFVSIATGFGWLMTPLFDTQDYLDVSAPQMSPFFSSLANVHLPLTIAFLAMLATMMMVVFRPGHTIVPRLDNGTVLIFIIGLLLALVYPAGLFPLLVAMVFSIAVEIWQDRRLNSRYLRWMLWVFVPTLPLLVYYAIAFDFSVVAGAIWEQIVSVSPPSPIALVLSLGLPLLIALPGIFRGITKLEQDGDRFMIGWLLGMVALLYLPIPGNQSLVAIMIPIGYFATRSIEDVWFTYISRRWRMKVMVGIVPIIAATNLFVLLLPLRPISSQNLDEASGLLLENDYAVAFAWLERFASDGDVVLAAPNTSLWLPGWTGKQVVYGHPRETAQADTKRRAVLNWYNGSDEECESLLSGILHVPSAEYEVRYVIIGPQELHLGRTACGDWLTRQRQFGRVSVYEIRSEL